MDITIGIEKEIILPSGESGNYIRTGELKLDYNQDNPDGIDIERTGKIELILYKSLNAYQHGYKPMNWKYCVRFTYTLTDLYNPEKPIPELLYDKIYNYSYKQYDIDSDSYITIEPFKNANILKINI